MPEISSGLIEVKKLAQKTRFDCLLIESTGISELMPVAETLTFEDEEGESLPNVPELDTVIKPRNSFVRYAITTEAFLKSTRLFISTDTEQRGKSKRLTMKITDKLDC